MEFSSPISQVVKDPFSQWDAPVAVSVNPLEESQDVVPEPLGMSVSSVIVVIHFPEWNATISISINLSKPIDDSPPPKVWPVVIDL